MAGETLKRHLTIMVCTKFIIIIHFKENNQKLSLTNKSQMTLSNLVCTFFCS